MTNWIGSIVGYALTGMAMQAFGVSLAFGFGALLPLVGVLLLSSVPAKRPAYAT